MIGSAAVGRFIKPRPGMRVFVYFAFALTGVLTALPGPLLPTLLHRWMLSDAQGGSIIATQFLASMMGTLFANRNLRISLLLGLLLMAIGTLGLTVLPWPYLRAAIFCYGYGLGMSIPAINLIVAAWHSDSRAASLSVLNSVWGVGAISCPALAFAARRFASINALLLVLSVSLALVFIFIPKKGSPAAWTVQKPMPRIQFSSGRRRPLWLFASLFFLYVGAETCIASWINVYAQRVIPGIAMLFFSPMACFWIALVIGRSGIPGILKLISAETLYLVSLIFALLAFMPVLAGTSTTALISGATFCGLAFAPIFPLLLTFASESLLSKPNSGWVFAGASLGGAVLPWATGAVSTAYRLRIGLLIPGAAITILLLSGLQWFGTARPLFLKREPKPLPIQ